VRVRSGWLGETGRRLMTRLFRRRPPHVVVYCVSEVVNGSAKTSPLGIAPGFSDEYEAAMRVKHQPVGAAYLSETINDVDVILFWTGESIEAVSFLHADDARSFRGFEPLSAEDLAEFDPVLTHFPR
jgi:hypothetical protein